MGIVIRKEGVLTTVQDRGRFGYQRKGFSTNGALDMRAYTIANMLVDNDLDAPAIEFILAGPRLRFTTNTIFALTGADFCATLNDKEIPTYKAIYAKRGSILKIKAPKRGVCGYLAIAGNGLAIEQIMGSRSTNLKCEFGGFEGRKLEVGDYIESNANLDFIPFFESHKISNDDNFYQFDKEDVELRVILGPQDDYFTNSGIATFFGSSFTLTRKCDRMGYRLDGPVVETKDGSDIISEGVTLGAIQIPSDGKPIIMMTDRQTTGGYAKIGNIVTIDIPKLVQRQAGTKVHFTPVSVEEAQNLIKEEDLRLDRLNQKIHKPTPGSISPRTTARRLTPILKRQAIINTEKKLWIEQASINTRVGNRNKLEES